MNTLNNLSKGSYAEAGQTHATQFAVCKREKDGTFTLLHGTSMCREFINDYLWYQALDKAKQDRYSIYRFKVPKKGDPGITKTHGMFLFWQMDAKQKANFKKNLPLLKAMDKLAKFKGSKAHEVEEGYVIQIGYGWTTTSPAIAFVTLMHKCMILHEVDLDGNSPREDVRAMMEATVEAGSSNEANIIDGREETILDVVENFHKLELTDTPNSQALDICIYTKHAYGIQNFCHGLKYVGDKSPAYCNQMKELISADAEATV